VDPAMLEQITGEEDHGGRVASRSPAAHPSWVREGEVVVKSGATR
jgi:hypothetical protein